MNHHQNRFAPDDFDDNRYFLHELFQGMQHDPDHPWFMERTRAFHPTVKRWLNTEPMACVDSLNAHAAMADNPINAINPSARDRLYAGGVSVV